MIHVANDTFKSSTNCAMVRDFEINILVQDTQFSNKA